MTTTVINYRSIPPDGHQRRAALDLTDPYVYIGRPSKWGNPFPVDDVGRDMAIEMYRDWVTVRMDDGNDDFLADIKSELKGKTLVCWCKPLACHGDVLAELADS